MVVLETVCVAFAMFSALPVPHADWNERNMRYAMAAFPLVGAVIGALWCVCGLLPLPDMLKAAGFCLIPVAATGGIHLDGFADTSDALSSYGDREKKLAILKDPHCGAFAVIRLCGYFVLYFALCACLRFTPRVGAVWTLALVLDRALSGSAAARAWRCWAAGCLRWRRWLSFCGIAPWRRSSSAALRAIWRAGFCSAQSLSCWRHC